MLYELIQRIKNDKRYALFFVLIIISVAVIVFVSLLLQRSYVSHRLTEIQTSGRSFSVFDDPYVYSFNGMSFHRLNVDDGSVSILQTGLKLPQPDNVMWASEKGALLTFSESFWLSEPQKYAIDDGAPVTDMSYTTYTWYVDFSTGSLHLVNEDTALRGVGYFSKEKGSLYYVTRPDSGNATLNRFDIDSLSNDVVAENLAITDISSINECRVEDSQKSCITARYQDNLSEATMTSFSDDGDSQIEISTSGRLFSSNNGDYYIVFDRGAIDRRTGRLASVDQADTTEEQAVLFDIAAGVEYELDYSSDGNNILPYFTNDGSFFIFDNSLSTQNSMRYLSGVIDDGQAHSSVVELDNSSGIPTLEFSRIHTTSSTTDLLISNVVGDLSLLHVDNSRVILPNRVDRADIEQGLSGCYSGSNGIDISFSEEESLYLIYLIENEQYYSAVNEIGSCFTQNNAEAMIRNSFYYGARDPHSGRITTD